MKNKINNTKKYYAIIYTENPNWYWNEEWGWINIPIRDEGEISLYSEEEKERTHLPPGGKWKLL